MSIHEELSRLMAGELPPDRSEALRRRIETDPEASAAWESLLEVRHLLEDLPAEITPPAALDRRVLGEPAPRSRHLPRALPWVAAVAAAVLAWIALDRAPAPDLVLADGAQWVSGAAVVHAGDARIEVDGVARIEVEPPAGGARVPARQTTGDPMRKEAILAGLVGSIVTVTVYEGQALVHADEGAPILVQAGETRAMGQPTRKITRPAAAPPPAGETEEQTIARLQQELEATRAQLEEAEFLGAVARGQLVAHQGEVSRWPEGVPPEVSPDRFAQTLSERLAEHPLAVEHVDCTEYPCIAAMKVDGAEGDEWFRAVEADLRGLVHDAYGDEASVGLFRFRFEDDERGTASDYVVFGTWDGDDATGEHDAVRQRTSYRFDQMTTELEAGIGAP